MTRRRSRAARYPGARGGAAQPRAGDHPARRGEPGRDEPGDDGGGRHRHRGVRHLSAALPAAQPGPGGGGRGGQRRRRPRPGRRPRRLARRTRRGRRRPASTGPALPAAAHARGQRELDARVVRVLGDPGTVTARWTPLAERIDRRLTADGYWTSLAERLTTAERAGIDVAALVRAAADRPLPDEQPAAALWWRLAGRLSPAAMTAGQFSAQTLRPGRIPVLATIVGRADADRLLADEGWPALVAAVSSARSAGWRPEQLLATAHELLRAGH